MHPSTPSPESPAPDAFDLQIGWLDEHDLRAVLAIERASFSRGTRWTETDFVCALRQRNCLGRTAAAVVDDDQGDFRQVAGYMIYELSKQYITLTNFAVAPGFRRRGVGRRLIATLANLLSFQRRTRIELEIRESNLEGQLFFRATGFRAEKVLRQRWPKLGEDAYRMVYRYRGTKRTAKPAGLSG